MLGWLRLGQKMKNETAQSLSKDLAIRLAVRELENLIGDPNLGTHEARADAIISNLLIGLGCELVVDAWTRIYDEML